jgi:hypothetical protein
VNPDMAQDSKTWLLHPELSVPLANALEPAVSSIPLENGASAGAPQDVVAEEVALADVADAGDPADAEEPEEAEKLATNQKGNKGNAGQGNKGKKKKK